jgi:outer membrane protein OmpA-like peptidoglycan-associated protein/tetratricopeptide (TPR) repeat protein
MKIFFAFLFLLGFQELRAQYDPSKVNRKAMQLYEKALDQARDENFRGGIDLLKQAVQIDGNYEEAYLSMAGMYGELKDYRESVDNYKLAIAIDSNFAIDYLLPYSINLAGLGEFQEALDAVNRFLTIPNLNETSQRSAQFRKNSYQFALDYAARNIQRDYKFEPHNLGDSINTPVSEYYPTISLDGNTLIYTRRVNDNNEDFYESDKIDGVWSRSKALVGNINTNMNEGAQNVSQDGQWLIFTGCNFPEGYGSCDLYISYLTGEGWSNPENLGENINTEFWESAPSLSPDKRDLYFSSRRPGGYGGNDLYVCHRQQNGHWTAPENMGPGINTAGDESAPFIHADNQSLYFTSNGLPGYGGDDLFVARKGPDGSWGKPENLGYPINTVEDEGSLVVAADGKTAYYASNRADSRGELDIYSFELRSDVRPFRTLWVEGKVFDKKTLKGLPSSVRLVDLETRQVMSDLQTDETGNYLITLPVGKNYAFEVNRRGYLFFSENFPLSDKQPDSVYHIDIPLQPLEANASMILKNIFFDVNKSELKPASQVELDEMVQLLKDNPALSILVSGHTDNAGKPADNLLLSDNRAKAVVNYLTAKGISRYRLFYKGFGDTQPIDDNKTESGRARNRRTELKVVKAQ